MSQAAPASSYDIAVIGAGPSGCAAALAARGAGAARVLLADMAANPGGALVAMGMRYNAATEHTLNLERIDQAYRSSLLTIAAHPPGGLALTLLGPGGLRQVHAHAAVLATGAREQTRGNLAIAGTRPAGVLTAGAALRWLAATGQLPGRRAAIAGAGRWAAETAAALERAGATIVARAAAVARIDGWPRVTGVMLGDGREQPCDLLVLATPQLAWLAPPLAGAGNLPGVFVAGGAARGETSAAEAAALGEQAGRAAVAWAASQKF